MDTFFTLFPKLGFLTSSCFREYIFYEFTRTRLPMHWLNCKGFLLQLQMCTYYCKVWKEKGILWNGGFIIYSFKTIDLSHQFKTYSRVYKLGNMVREAERCHFYLTIFDWGVLPTSRTMGVGAHQIPSLEEMHSTKTNHA